MQKIIIEEYNSSWPSLFEQEKKKLVEVLPAETVIEHIGSTAVPGLAAKPIIDIMIGVSSLKIADQQCIEPIQKQGYTYVPEYEKMYPERRYFRKKNQENVATHHIHLVVTDSSFWKRHLHFRNYLRTHPKAVAEYAQLKRDLAEKFIDTNEYARAKTEFIQKIEAEVPLC